MRRLLKTLILSLVVLLAACDDPFEHAHCDDTAIAKAKSPDGKYVVTGYHRSCARGTGLYTWVRIENVPPHFWSMRSDAPIGSVTGYHQITMTWKDATNVEISTPGLHQVDSPPSLTDNWEGVSISYK